MPEPINPKEVALILYKLSLENNAMLQQILMLQTELLKVANIIHSATNKKFGPDLKQELELLHEKHRQEKVECLANMTVHGEEMRRITLQDWLKKAMQSGDLSGSIDDYKTFMMMGQMDTVNTASHD